MAKNEEISFCLNFIIILIFIFAMLNSETIQQLTKIIIRPHRQIYTYDKLGPRKIVVKSLISGKYIQVIRKEATLVNQGRKLQVSLFQPQISINQDSKGWHSPSNHKKQTFEQLQYKSTIFTNQQLAPNSQCTIFLHSNSGSRLEGLEYIKYVLQYNQIVCLFDYSGSGLSEGQYVTMGINQCQDLKKVVSFLKEKYNISQFTLWGRSMGAVTALMYASMQPFRVSKMVLDSPFSNFKQLVKQIVNTRTGLPDFLFGSIIDKIEEEIILKTSHNLMDIDIRKNIKEKGMNQISCLFLISKDDKLVKPNHVEVLHSLHEGPKEIFFLEGSHNKPRPHDIRERCSKFLCENSSQKKKEPEKKYHPVSLSNHRRSSESAANIPSKNKKVVQSIIISQSTEGSKTINNSPKGFSKGFNKAFNKCPIEISKMNENKVHYPSSSSNTQRQDQSLGKLNPSKISLSQIKRSINVGLVKSGNMNSLSFKKSEEIKTNESKIFQNKQHQPIKEVVKEESDIKPMKNTKGFMMAAKYKNKLKEHLIKN